LLLEGPHDLDQDVLRGYVQVGQPIHAAPGALARFGQSPGELTYDGAVLDRAALDPGKLAAGGDRRGLAVGQEADRDRPLGNRVGQIAPRVASSSSCSCNWRNSGPTTLQ